MEVNATRNTGLTEAESIAIIERLAKKSLMVELLYLRDDIDRGDDEDDSDPEFPPMPYTLLDAFDDVWDKVDGDPNYDNWLLNCREICIALNWYKVVTEDELSRTITLSGGRGSKSYAFKHKGLKYKFNTDALKTCAQGAIA